MLRPRDRSCFRPVVEKKSQMHLNLFFFFYFGPRSFLHTTGSNTSVAVFGDCCHGMSAVFAAFFLVVALKATLKSLRNFRFLFFFFFWAVLNGVFFFKFFVYVSFSVAVVFLSRRTTLCPLSVFPFSVYSYLLVVFYNLPMHVYRI